MAGARAQAPTWTRRLLLGALVAAGAVGLRVLDEVVVAGYRADIDAEALQAGAALEGAIGGRVARLHALQSALAEVDSDAERVERFRVIAREIQQSAPDVQFLYLIDTAGVVREMHAADGIAALPEDGRIRITGSSPAFQAAKQRGAAQLSNTVPLRGGGRGLVIYDPIVRSDRIVGYVGGGFSYASLFAGALGRELRGRAPFRVLDDVGFTVTASRSFPATLSAAATGGLVSREVYLPAGRRWHVQYLIAPREPTIARAALWLVGLALLGTLVGVALREEERAERAATHTRRLEQLSRELLDANVRLEERAMQVAEANRAKSRFLAHVSHELRTPLNAILGYNSLVIEGVYGPVPPPLADAHARIRAAGTHLLSVVDAVLDLSRLELNRLAIEASEVRVDALLADVAAVIEPSAEAKGLRVDVIVEPDVPTLHTDARHLRRALLALATNAIKFTEQGAVTLAARYDADDDRPRITLAVDDTGPGIAPEDHARIFEEFEQVRPPGRGDSIARGAGLGLAVARKLVRLLGGDVRVTSALGAGARFDIALPIARPVAMAARNTPLARVGRP